MRSNNKVKIISNTSHHTYIIGKIYRIVSVNKINKNAILKGRDGIIGNNIRFVDMELILNEETINENILIIKDKMNYLKKILKYMDETNSNEISTNDFKIAYVIEISNDKTLSIKKKSEIIERLISNDFVVYDL